jgi:hypothetical protein
MCKSYVACNLLSASDVSTALGMTVSAGTEGDDMLGGFQSYGCTYGPTSATISVKLTVSCDPSIKNGPDVYNLLPGIYGGMATPISGLGDAAFWLPGGGDGGPGIGAPKVLIVYFGGYSNFSVTVLSSSSSTLDAQMVAQQIATTVAHNLML